MSLLPVEGLVTIIVTESIGPWIRVMFHVIKFLLVSFRRERITFTHLWFSKHFLACGRRSDGRSHSYFFQQVKVNIERESAIPVGPSDIP